jgi:hypothetical protein
MGQNVIVGSMAARLYLIGSLHDALNLGTTPWTKVLISVDFKGSPVPSDLVIVDVHSVNEFP